MDSREFHTYKQDLSNFIDNIKTVIVKWRNKEDITTDSFSKELTILKTFIDIQFSGIQAQINLLQQTVDRIKIRE